MHCALNCNTYVNTRAYIYFQDPLRVLRWNHRNLCVRNALYLYICIYLVFCWNQTMEIKARKIVLIIVIYTRKATRVRYCIYVLYPAKSCQFRYAADKATLRYLSVSNIWYMEEVCSKTNLKQGQNLLKVCHVFYVFFFFPGLIPKSYRETLVKNKYQSKWTAGMHTIIAKKLSIRLDFDISLSIWL